MTELQDLTFSPTQLPEQGGPGVVGGLYIGIMVYSKTTVETQLLGLAVKKKNTLYKIG